MNVLAILIPISLVLGGLGAVAFIWSIRANQYDDPEGQAARILMDEEALCRAPKSQTARSD